VKRLAIVAPNWLGDAVMALPAIADVRRGQPDASIAVAARPSVAPLFGLARGVDDVIPLEDGGARLAGHDAVLLLPNSFHSALMAKRAGVHDRWGYATDWRSFLLTRPVPRAPAALHQIDYYQHLVRALGFPNGPAAPRIELAANLRDAGAGVLRQAGWDGRAPVVAIAPGAAYGPAKRWPPSSFADLAAGLAGDGMVTVVVGAASDRGTAADVARSAQGRVTLIDLVGRTDIPGLAGVLVHCQALVANDSGALHLAAALGVRVTAVFGPTNERLTAPRSAAHVSVVTHPVWCRPCLLRECPLDHECMRQIPVHRVLDETRRLM